MVGAPAGRADEALRAVGLAEHAGRPGGAPVRWPAGAVVARRGPVGRPPVLLLDEPTVGLDPLLRRDLWRTFHALAADGAALLVSSHVMDEAAECDDLLLMRDGRLLAALTPDALRADTGADDLGEAFLRLIERDEAVAA